MSSEYSNEYDKPIVNKICNNLNDIIIENYFIIIEKENNTFYDKNKIYYTKLSNFKIFKKKFYQI